MPRIFCANPENPIETGGDCLTAKNDTFYPIVSASDMFTYRAYENCLRDHEWDAMNMNRTALVVGAASGMGRATALRLAERGYAVGVADVNEPALRTLAEELRLRRAPHHVELVDLRDGETIDVAVSGARAALGPLWLLAVSAGVLASAPALESSEEQLEQVMRVNFYGVARANIAAARIMIEDGVGGRIVNWSSVGAVGGAAGHAAYAASKAALESFSRTLAVELGPHGITVNVIRPGTVMTPMLGSLSDYSAEDIARETSRIPLGRFGEPADVAGAVVFLSSEEAAWVTGVALPVDGGTLTMRGRDNIDVVSARTSGYTDEAASGS